MAVVLTLHGAPRTKKNSQRIVTIKGRPCILPSAEYKRYEGECIRQMIGIVDRPVPGPVNLKCLYYMPTRRRVDLVNLLEATCDILVHAGVIADDDCTIIAGHDGSRVLYDKENPRVEITIGGLKNDDAFH